jgi:polyferredoxin
LSPLNWQRLRKATQILSIIILVFLFTQSVYLGQDSPFNGIFFHLDPLVAITTMLAGRLIIVSFILAFITIILTIIFGRAWCGWICPLGTLLEWFAPRIKKATGKTRNISPQWRKVKYILLVVILAAAFLGNQTLIFFDPITILTRTTATVIWPALRYGVSSVESFLYQFKFLWSLLDEIHNVVIVPLFHNTQSVF